MTTNNTTSRIRRDRKEGGKQQEKGDDDDDALMMIMRADTIESYHCSPPPRPLTTHPYPQPPGSLKGSLDGHHSPG